MTIVSRLCVDVYGLVSDVCIYSGDCVLFCQVLYMDGCQCLCGHASGFQTTLWFLYDCSGFILLVFMWIMLVLGLYFKSHPRVPGAWDPGA